MMLSVLPRAIWIALFVALGWISANVSMDFASEKRPQLSALVSTPFQSHSLGVIVVNDLDQGNSTEAYDRSRRLIAARPVPAENLTLLALSAGSFGTPDGNTLSSQAITMAAQRGWREPISQLSFVAAAIEGENWDIAADRIEAIYRTGNESLLLPDTLDQVVASEQGLDALARKLSSGDNPLRSQRARNQIIQDSFEKLEAPAFSTLVAAAADYETEFDCRQVSRMARSLLVAEQVDEAKSVWYRACESDADASRASFALEQSSSSDAASPFDWSYPKEPGVSRTFASPSDGPATLSFRNRDKLERTLASRYTTLTPGTYVFSAEVKMGGGLSSEGVLRLGVFCFGEDVPHPRNMAPLTNGDVTLNIEENCPAQRFVILLRPTAGVPGTLSFSP